MSNNKRFIVDDAGSLIDLHKIRYYDYVSDLLGLLNEFEDEVNNLKRENRTLKVLYCKCRDCKYANLYIPHYTYPYVLPKCKITGNDIELTQNACEDFERIGRNSR